MQQESHTTVPSSRLSATSRSTPPLSHNTSNSPYSSNQHLHTSHINQTQQVQQQHSLGNITPATQSAIRSAHGSSSSLSSLGGGAGVAGGLGTGGFHRSGSNHRIPSPASSPATVSSQQQDTFARSSPLAPGQQVPTDSVGSSAGNRPLQRWVPPSQAQQRAESQNNAIFRRTRGILNKLTPDKFEKLTTELVAMVGPGSPDILKGVILLIFDKALDEPKYSSMYAQLCRRIDKQLNSDTFCTLLLRKSQSEFTNRNVASEQYEGRVGELTPDEEESRHIAKQKMLGNIKFICELGKEKLLNEGILHECVQCLLKRKPTIRELAEDLECLCQIMKTIGAQLDNAKSANLTEQYFKQMAKYERDERLPQRIRFLLRDVIELRENRWTPVRRVQRENGPAPIQQIRSEAARELGIQMPPSPAQIAMQQQLLLGLAGLGRLDTAGGVNPFANALGGGLLPPPGSGPGGINLPPHLLASPGLPGVGGMIPFNNMNNMMSSQGGPLSGANMKSVDNKGSSGGSGIGMAPNYNVGNTSNVSTNASNNKRNVSPSPSHSPSPRLNNRSMDPHQSQHQQYQKQGNNQTAQNNPKQPYPTNTFESRDGSGHQGGGNQGYQTGSTPNSRFSNLGSQQSGHSGYNKSYGVSGGSHSGPGGGPGGGSARNIQNVSQLPPRLQRKLQQEQQQQVFHHQNQPPQHQQQGPYGSNFNPHQNTNQSYQPNQSQHSQHPNQQHYNQNHPNQHNNRLAGLSSAAGALYAGMNSVAGGEISLRPPENSIVSGQQGAGGGHFNRSGSLPTMGSALTLQGPNLGLYPSKNSPNSLRRESHDVAMIENQNAGDSKENGSSSGQGLEKKLSERDKFIQTFTSTVDSYLMNITEGSSEQKQPGDEDGDGDLLKRIGNLNISNSYQPDALLILMKKYFDHEIQLASVILQLSLSNDIYIKSYKSLLNELPTLETTVPRVKSHFAGLLARLIIAGKLSLNDAADPLAGGRHYPLFLLTLQQMSKSQGSDWLAREFSASRINVMQMVPECDRRKERLADILDDRGLSALAPLYRIEVDLMRQFQLLPSSETKKKPSVSSECSSTATTSSGSASPPGESGAGGDGPQTDDQVNSLSPSPTKTSSAISVQQQQPLAAGPLWRWIKEKVSPGVLKSSGFVSILATILLKYAHQMATSSSSSKQTSDSVTPSSTGISPETILTQYKPILQAIVHDSTELQLVLVYTFQEHVHHIGFPKGLMLKYFNWLYDSEIVDDDTFLKWKEDINDSYPGKGKALFQVNQWLTWLEQDEDEEDDEEE